jgi:hypothetical protein
VFPYWAEELSQLPKRKHDAYHALRRCVLQNTF